MPPPQHAGQSALRTRLQSWTWLLPFGAAGACLRLYGIDEQILGGDELHAINAALGMRLSELPITYGLNDHSPPLALLYALLFRSGLSISELVLRAPILASSVALVLVAPLLAERLLDRRSAAVFGWLLAVSPLLVLYGRVVRSYAPIAFLGFSAAYAGYRWLEGARRGCAVAYALLAASAIYFHLLAAPFVLAPILFAALEKLLARRRGRLSWRALFATGGAVLVLVSCFTIPARKALLGLLQLRALTASVGSETLLGALELQAGSRHLVAVALFWLLAGSGLEGLWRTRPRLAGFTLTVATVQLVAVLSLSPTSADQAIVTNRYLLISLPVVLLWVAVGIARAAGVARAAGSARLGTAVTFAIVAALFVAGPLPGYHLEGRAPFLGHNDFITFHCERPHAPPGRTPAFYARLRREANGETLAEFPWGLSWYSTRFPHVHQGVHRQEVIVATPLKLPSHPGLRFRNAVASDPGSLLESRAGFLVVHQQLTLEEGGLIEPPCGFGRGSYGARVREVLARKTPRAIGHFRRAFGDPVYEDALILVWDLRAVRAARGAR